MNNPRASLAIGGTVLLWASAFPAIRVGLHAYGPVGLSFLRLAVASIALLIVAPLLGVRLPARRELPMIVVAGVTGMTAYQLLLNTGEVHVTAGTASLLVATAPVFSAALAAIFLGERLGWRGLVGSLTALCGSVLIAVASGDTRYSSAAWLVLAAAAMQGAYHFCGKPLLREHTGLEVACYAMWAGTVGTLPFAPQAIRAIPHAPSGATAAVVFLGLLPSAVGFILWGYGVARFPVTVATAGLYLVPVVAIVVSFGWLGERPTPIELIGGVISIGGVLLISADRRIRLRTTTVRPPHPVPAAVPRPEPGRTRSV